MDNDNATANAEAGLQSVVGNISASDYALKRAQQLMGSPQPEVEQPVDKEVIEVETVDEGTVELVEETEEVIESEGNVHSQLDLDEMSEDELKELSEKLGSRAVARFGELTAKRKAAEEKLAQLQNQLKENSSNPLQQEDKIEDNPYKEVSSLSDLQEKATENNQVIEWAEDVLFDSDDYGANDVVAEIEGKELTKSEVRKALKNARKSRDKYLPSQLKQIQAKEHGVQLKQMFQQQAETELDWMKGEDNDTRKQYEAIVSDPRFKDLEKTLPPEVSAQLPYLMAHAANSMYNRKVVQDTASSPRVKPNSSPMSAAAQSEKASTRANKSLIEAKKRYQQTGNTSDFIKLRTLKLQNKF